MADGTHIALQVWQLFDAEATAWTSKYAPDGHLAGRLTRPASAVTYHVPATATCWPARWSGWTALLLLPRLVGVRSDRVESRQHDR